MDERHRQYCIKLGNPYMREERYQEQFKTKQTDYFWVPENRMQDDNCMKNSKKFTN